MSQQIKTLSAQNLAIFCEQAAMLLRSGILLHDGIQMIAQDAPPGDMRQALLITARELSESRPFQEALETAGIFPPYLIHMAAVGVESGNLDCVMDSLALYYKRRHAMQEMLKSAILYPTVLVAMMAAVLLLIAVKVLPVFQRVLQSLGTELSSAAAAIMKAGDFFSRFSYLFAATAVLLLAAGLYLGRTEKGRRRLSGLMAGTKLSETFALSALSSSLATMLASGVETERALELSISTLSNPKVKERAERCKKIIAEDHLSLTEALEKTAMFPGVMVSILSTGARAGSLDEAMQYVSGLCEEAFENSISKKLSLIEPISVSVLSVLIGIILISVMIPLLGVMSAIGA